MKQSRRLFLSLFVFAVSHARSQEFFVTMSPVSALPTIFDTLSEVKFIQGSPAFRTFDHVHNHFFFKGQTWSGVDNFYTVDALAGKIIKRIPTAFLNPGFANVGNLQFEDSTGFIYSTGNMGNQSQLYLLKMDTVAAIISTVCMIPAATQAIVNEATFDQVNGLYICLTNGNSGGYKLQVIDVSTGSILASPTLSVLGLSPTTLRFNSKTGKLYGIKSNTSIGLPRHLVEFNQLTGAVVNTVISMGLLFDAPSNPNYCSIDEVNNRMTYYFGNNLATVDLGSGAMTYSPICNTWATPNPLLDNVIEFEYSHSNGNLYALHWKYFDPTKVGIQEESTDLKFNLFPNPVDKQVSFTSPDPLKKFTLTVYDSRGRLVIQKVLSPQTEYQLQTEDFSSGMYSLLMQSEDGRRYSTRMFRH